jgi:hypothetical protein
MKTIKLNIVLMLLLIIVSCCKKDDPYSYNNTLRYVNEYNRNLGVPHAKVKFYTSVGGGIGNGSAQGGEIWEGETDEFGYIKVNLNVGKGKRLQAVLQETNLYFGESIGAVGNLDLVDEKKVDPVHTIKPRCWLKFHIKTNSPVDTGDFLSFCNLNPIMEFENCRWKIAKKIGNIDTILSYCPFLGSNYCGLQFEDKSATYSFLVKRNGIIKTQYSPTFNFKMLDTVTVDINY